MRSFYRTGASPDLCNKAKELPSLLEGLVVGLPVDGLVLGREGLAHAVILPDRRKP